MASAFRVISGFMAQFGIHGDPKVSAPGVARIQDDQVKQSNKRAYISYAMAGQRSHDATFHQLYRQLQAGSDGFAPIARVVEGMDVVDRLHAGYGEGAPQGKGPEQGRLQMEGARISARIFPARLHQRVRSSNETGAHCGWQFWRQVQRAAKELLMKFALIYQVSYPNPGPTS